MHEAERVVWHDVSREVVSCCVGVVTAIVRGFKDKVYPLFESDTLFLECCVALCLVV